MNENLFKECIVNKPWGYEYLAYENEELSIWLLHLNHGAQTSLHCHPNKKTSLILLDGEAEISFITSKIEARELFKIVIYPRVFHSTKSISEDGIYVFEIETPKDKGDLVRVKDEYGRKFKPYEDEKSLVKKTDECLWMKDGGEYSFHNKSITIENISKDADIENVKNDEIVALLRGNIFSERGDKLLMPGDAIKGDAFNKFITEFPDKSDILLMRIRK